MQREKGCATREAEPYGMAVGLDARGFLFGPLIALRLGAAFVPVRKQGKLPGECAQATYVKEYGEVNNHLALKRETLGLIQLGMCLGCFRDPKGCSQGRSKCHCH